MSSLTQEERVAKEREDYEALLKACEDFEAKGPKSCHTASQLNKMYRDLAQFRKETGKLFPHSREFWKERNALTITLMDLQMTLLPEEDEDGGENNGALPGTMRELTSGISAITDKHIPGKLIPEGLSEIALRSSLDGSGSFETDSSSKATNSFPVESEPGEDFELLRQPSSAASFSEGEKEKKEDDDWHMV